VIEEEYKIYVEFLGFKDGRPNWKIVNPFHIDCGDRTYLIEGGFETDFASIPPYFYWFAAPSAGEWLHASILHDWMYENTHDRKVADRVFRQKMKEDGVNFVRRNIMYFAVRLFGADGFGPKEGS